MTGFLRLPPLARWRTAVFAAGVAVAVGAPVAAHAEWEHHRWQGHEWREHQEWRAHGPYVYGYAPAPTYYYGPTYAPSYGYGYAYPGPSLSFSFRN